MSIFGWGIKKPTRVNEVQINQSVLGYPLPVVLGKGKVQQSLLWVDGMTAKLVSQGGKGIGGGKGGTQYLYSADVIAGLCNGPISAIGDVWCAGSWLSNNSTSESYTISGGSPVYTPTNAGSGVFIDHGVYLPTSYSGTYSDVGSSGTVLSGTDNVPFLAMAYGTSLASGQYSVDPATNNYHFAAADAGKTVTISYAFALNIIKQQERDLVPSGRNIAVGGVLTFHEDDGVVYNSGPNIGKALTKVSGTPSATGTYSVSGSGPATYHFATGDIGVQVIITFKVQNNSAVPTGAPGTLNFAVYEGFKGQAVWSLLTSTFPGAALGYTMVAYVAYNPMTLGYAADIQQNVFEVLTGDSYGGGIVDCNPIQCLLQVLTNPVWGLGAGAVPFPASVIDNGSGGTWGTAAWGSRQVNGTAFTWFAANGFFISPVIDHQDSAASIMSKWLEAGQCAAFMSEGLLKLVPFGDTSTAGNGCTWTAPSFFAAALDDTCFVQKQEGEEPVKISSSPWQDAYNTVQVQWNNRGAQYSPEITPESDQAAINRYGSRIEDPQSWDFITTLAAATFAASMRVKRNVYTRNTYEFTLPFAYSFLECMDVVDITTSSQWAAGLNNANLSIVNLPVRITKIVDNPDGTLNITAEDYPFGVHQPTLYNKGIGSGQTRQNIFEDPGDTTGVIFEAPSRLANYQRGEVWIGATGASANWGSCNVFVSMDGTTYKQIGTVDSQARLGTLASTMLTGNDPDTANSLVVNLAENSPALEAGTTADADQANTLAYVDGELIAYSACQITGQDQYTMGTYIRRGLFGSTIGVHFAGSEFVRLDENVFQFEYDPTWAGKTVYFKLQSVNTFGNAAQDLSTLTAIPFLITGQLAPPPAGTITVLNSNFEIGADLPPYGWMIPPSGAVPNNTGYDPTQLGYDTTGQYQGSRSFVIKSPAGKVTSIDTSQKFNVIQGDTYKLFAAIKAVSSDAITQGVASLAFYGKDDTDYKGGVGLAVSGGVSGWQVLTGVSAVPVGATYARIVLSSYAVGSSNAANFEFDCIQLIRQANLSADVVGTLPIGSVGPRTAAVTYIIDGAGSVITTGIKGQVSIPANATINSWNLTADQSGSAVVDVLHSTYAGFPTTSSIAGTDKPTLSSAQKNQNAGPLSAWSTALTAGDVLQFNVNSCSTCTRLVLTLNISITG